MIWAFQDFILYIVLGLVGGVATEQISNRKLWPPIALILAVVISAAGAIVGAVIAYSLGFKDPELFDVPIIPAIVGLIIFMIPWFIIRSGRTPTKYNQNHKWKQNIKH